MAEPLPLASASERLRGKQGRPRLSDEEKSKRAATRKAHQVAHLATVAPRLFNIPGAARYLACSEWTVRDLLAAGVLARVVIPAGPGRDLRRVLLDRQQLDELVMLWRESTR